MMHDSGLETRFGLPLSLLLALQHQHVLKIKIPAPEVAKEIF